MLIRKMIGVLGCIRRARFNRLNQRTLQAVILRDGIYSSYSIDNDIR